MSLDGLCSRRGERIEELVRICEEKDAEIERLREITKRLPETVDGVRIVPDMRVYLVSRSALVVTSWTVGKVGTNSIEIHHWPYTGRYVTPDQCFSTVEAARKASQ